MNKDKLDYETSSLALAATLICLGVKLDTVSKDAEKKSTFSFIRTPSLSQIIESFWNRNLKVEPNSFWEAQRFLKSRIYGEE